MHYWRLPAGQVVQYLADLDRVTQNFVARKKVTGHRLATALVLRGEPLSEVGPLDILHHQVVVPTLREVGIQVGDARVLQVTKGARLGLKTLHRFLPLLGIGGIKVFDHLFEDGQPVEGLGLGHQPDGSHPPFAQRAHNAIGTAVQQLFCLQAGSPAT